MTTRRIASLSLAGMALAASLFTALPAMAQNATPKVQIKTSMGDIVLELNEAKAPKTVANFMQYVRDKHYDGTVFHRVMDGFMAQTGDGQNFNGTGGSKYPNLKAEFSPTPYKRGIVGMARSASEDSANSQFFIMLGENPGLNGKYTVVGEVVSGMDVVDKIKKAPAGSASGAVTDPDKMIKVQVASDIK